MAERPSVKEILALARKGGPAKPSEEGAAPRSPAEEPPSAPAEPSAAEASAAPEPAPSAPPAPAANVPTPEKLGRPLTLKEKLAAARVAGAAVPGASKPAAAPTPPPAEAAATEAEAAPSAPPAPAAEIPMPEKLGRPLTLKEKLAAARVAGGGTTPAASKPAAAAKPAAAPAAKGAAAAPRTLPPLDKITDPKDLAEALRQAGAKKEKEVAAATAKAAPVKAPAREKESKPQTVLPKPSKAAKEAALAASTPASRRLFLLGSLFTSWIFVGWASFTAGCAAFTAMMGRFMFPNVLAEPPSTIKIGLPSNYEQEEVNERFKAEWGFWVVRSTRYKGTEIIYALKSVCTHLGCPPNWLAGEQKFKCPCHGSGFYISGINFEGPAPRPLERFKLSLGDDGQLVVDKSQIFQQELGQWEDPDSYVTA
jgi:cytochrome b6-f complex iron-sulfur subunit